MCARRVRAQHESQINICTGESTGQTWQEFIKGVSTSDLLTRLGEVRNKHITRGEGEKDSS